VSCGPVQYAPPRCRLRRLFTRPGVELRGYGADDRVEVPSTRIFVIGRVFDAGLQIDEMIGGRQTFGIYWSAPRWELHVNNEWAIATVDGERIGGFETRPLENGSVVEIRHTQTEALVHRFRVELG